MGLFVLLVTAWIMYEYTILHGKLFDNCFMKKQELNNGEIYLKSPTRPLTNQYGVFYSNY